MLNEDKDQTDDRELLCFEKREGKHIFPANRYFRSDYISGRILRSFFLIPLLHFMRAHVGALQHGASFKCNGTVMRLVGAAKAGAVLYVAGLVLYLIITWIVSSKRYEYAKAWHAGLHRKAETAGETL